LRLGLAASVALALVLSLAAAPASCRLEWDASPALASPTSPAKAEAAKAEAAKAETAKTAKAETGLGQRINALFAPLMKGASRVMFFDPFAALGLYDPVIYGAEGRPLRDAKGKVREARFPLVVLWLVFAAVFFTLRMRLINLRGFGHAAALVAGRYDQPDAPGEVTHFQALATALSGTVGLGNIAGVALAIGYGGPGATFWMIAAGLAGMATKFTECTLAVKYRHIGDDGAVSGGPPFYLREGFARRGWPRLGRGLAGVWAFFCVAGSFGGGNMFQANQSFALLKEMFPLLEGRGALYGAVLALCVGLVIVGGIKGIARVTSKIVPLMAVLYVATSLYVILGNIGELPRVFALIVRSAFDAPALHGGFLGVMVMGLRRAAFSNEAGVGTAAVAHAPARTHEPIAEGFVALQEPFVDTVVICTMTALVLIITGFHQGSGELSGAAMTAAAFGSVARWLPYLLMVAIVLFSFSTQLSFSYYGVTTFDYLLGGAAARVFGRRRVATHAYRVLFLACVVIGAATSTKAVMAYSDMIIFALIVTNTVGLYVMSGEVARDLTDYQRRRHAGELTRRP
jgi:AGCS family alanine or glycine:cation symporter